MLDVESEIERDPTDFVLLDFWGPASNFGIPIAAVMDTKKDPEMYVPYFASLENSLRALSESLFAISLCDCCEALDEGILCFRLPYASAVVADTSIVYLAG